MTDVANPLIAARQDSTTGWSGVGIAEGIDDLIAGIDSGSWIDSVIGGFATSMEALVLVVDPLGTLMSWGVGWLMEHVKPLSDALDWLAGDPDQINAYATTWQNVSQSVAGTAQDLADAVRREVIDWSGAAADAYRAHAAEQIAALDGITKAAHAIGQIVQGAGLVVALVREMVRDLIADFVSVLAVRLWEWIAEAGLTLGAATPLVIAQVGSLVAKWAAKIAELIAGLLRTMTRLMPIIRNLDEAIEALKQLLRTLARRGADGEEEWLRATRGPRFSTRNPGGEVAYGELSPKARHLVNHLQDGPTPIRPGEVSVDNLAELQRYGDVEVAIIQGPKGDLVLIQGDDTRTVIPSEYRRQGYLFIAHTHPENGPPGVRADGRNSMHKDLEYKRTPHIEVVISRTGDRTYFSYQGGDGARFVEPLEGETYVPGGPINPFGFIDPIVGL